MPPVPRPPVSNTTTSGLVPGDIGFGIYDLKPLATSAMHKGKRSRPLVSPQRLQSSAGAVVSEPEKNLKRLGDPLFTGTRSSSACRSSLYPRRRVEPSCSTSAVLSAASLPLRGGGAAPLSATRCGDGSVSADSGSLSSVTHQCCQGPVSLPETTSTPSTSTVEDRVRYLLQPIGTASLLAAPLQHILADVLRTLQQERLQLKGQRPCRRYPRSLGNGIDAEVTECLVDAAQAPSPMAAAEILASFIDSHPIDETTLHSSTAVLVGAALAELVTVSHVSSYGVTESQLLCLLDAAIGVGHPGAMLSVAVRLREGVGGLQREPAVSQTWLRCAASLGYLPAIHELAETYENGAFAPSKLPDESAEDASDWGEALQWYRQAAEAGYPPSQLNLGKLLLRASEHAQREGSATAPQIEHLTTEARRWLQACAAAGVEEAVRLLKRLEGPCKH